MNPNTAPVANSELIAGASRRKSAPGPLPSIGRPRMEALKAGEPRLSVRCPYPVLSKEKNVPKIAKRDQHNEVEYRSPMICFTSSHGRSDGFGPQTLASASCAASPDRHCRKLTDILRPVDDKLPRSIRAMNAPWQRQSAQAARQLRTGPSWSPECGCARAPTQAPRSMTNTGEWWLTVLY